MARPLRIDVADGWYHVMARGIERRALFNDRRDHEHFLELLEATVERFRVILHAHVEVANHYHAIIQTPDKTSCFSGAIGHDRCCFGRRAATLA